MSASKTGLLIVAGLVLLIGWLSVFIVDERELAIRFRLGEIMQSDYEPGLHFITPIINNVRKFDRLSLIHISEPTRQPATSRMPSSA